jgi:hypothetical protein
LGVVDELVAIVNLQKVIMEKARRWNAGNNLLWSQKQISNLIRKTVGLVQHIRGGSSTSGEPWQVSADP